LGLREDIKLVVSQKYSSLQEAINASAEARVKGPIPRANNNDRNKYDQTFVREKPMTTLTGVTGYQVKTIEKIRVTVRLGDKEIRHTMHIVRDDFLRL